MSRIHGHFGRALAHVKRDPQATTTTVAHAASETANYAQQVVSTVSKSNIAIAVVISALGVALLSLCIIYKLRKRRKNRSNSVPGLWSPSTPESGFGFGDWKSPAVRSSGSASVEKPVKVVLADSYPGEAGWAPQIKSYRGVPVKNGALPGHVKAALEGRKWIPPIDVPIYSSERSPPPSYIVANAGPKIPLPPVPVEDDTPHPPTPPTPPANSKLKVPTNFPPSRFSNDTPVSVTAEPLPSPARSSSFAHQQRRSSAGKHLSVIVSKVNQVISSESSLPRLMTVTNTFTPSLDDELLISISDTVRLLEEYHDGWCLVEHVGRPNCPRGVVPRFCLVERQAVKSSGSRSRSLTKSGRR